MATFGLGTPNQTAIPADSAFALDYAPYERDPERARELLREAEGTRRGSYGGAVGYLRGDGDFDTCIVIRSAFVAGGTATVQAGAGVVRDSDPQAEADETLHKAYAVLQAIAGGRDLEVEK